jgi:hypothetical protein
MRSLLAARYVLMVRYASHQRFMSSSWRLRGAEELARMTVNGGSGPSRPFSTIIAARPFLLPAWSSRRLMHILAEVERIGRLEYEYGNPLAEVLPWNSISKPS